MGELSLRTEVTQYLRSKTIAVISTISKEGKPMSATIYFLVDNDFNFYFITKTFTRKHHNIQLNPNIAMVVGTDNEPVTLQIEGVAEKVEDELVFKEKFHKFVELFAKNRYVGPIFQLAPDDNKLVMYKIVPNWVRWLDLRGDKVDGSFVQVVP